MRKFHFFLLSFLISVCFTANLLSDDGMWMPHQMQTLNLNAQGLEMDPAELYNTDGTGLMSAVVHLGGGTGEFVSKSGLILTNHHVAFGALQRAATAENDYISHGFKAMHPGEEIPAQGYIADVLLGYKDVTEKFNSGLNADMSLRQKYDTIEKIKKSLIADAEKAGPDLRVRIASMYSGNQYYLFTFKRLKDIRIVYAPPRDLGNFGADIDNWMWPRHTCDFTFLRAYVSKENVGTVYSKNNVPYQPKTIIRISTDGVKEGDFTFIIGYPGRTYRNYTYSELLFEIDRFKKRIVHFKDQIAFFEAASKADKSVEIKYAGRIKSLNNGLKNYTGKLEGFQSSGIVEKKSAAEDHFKHWLKQSDTDQQNNSKILTKIDSFMKKQSNFYWRNARLNSLVSKYSGSAMLSQAHLLYRLAVEKGKADEDRDSGFQERDWDRIRMRVKIAERSYAPEVDKEYLLHQLSQLLAEDKDSSPDFLIRILRNKSNDELKGYVEDLYAKTNMTNIEYRLSLLDKTADEILKLNDPIINLAAELELELKKLRDEGKLLTQEKNDLKKIYLGQMLVKYDMNLAPDANSTIRFTYGNVAGYSPADAVHYQPVTTLGGVIEKDTGEFPFHVPKKLKQLHAAKDYGAYADPLLNDVPACFLNTTNVTGGNSGSPTLNSKGEQVGIIFDMTYESVIGDYYIIPELQRTISVDIKYVLFITDKYSEMGYLLDEMELTK